jgi:hypothetical protein
VSGPVRTGRAGDVGQYAGPAHPDSWIGTDGIGALGHSRTSHEVFGWCCLERDRTVDEEVWAWRLHYQREHDGADKTSRRTAG